MLRATQRAFSWQRVSSFWKRLGGPGWRAADDSPLQGLCETAQDVGEGAVGEVPAHNETASLSNPVVLGPPAIAALDELFEEAGIDRDLGRSAS
jgi:hypothetical protein